MLSRTVVRGASMGVALHEIQAMGRLKKRSRKSPKKPRQEPGRCSKEPVSDEESCATALPKSEDQYSSGANSCDEIQSLGGSSLTTDNGEQIPVSLRLQRSPTDEMEVTHKLSRLNFSMLSPHHTTGLVPGLEHLALPITSSLGFEVLSDVEACSELASATHLDLLPTFSDGGEGQEVEPHYRYARKRPSRRKTNRRSKRSRYMYSSSSRLQRHSQPVTMATPLPPGITRSSSDGSRLMRTRSLRRAKRSQPIQEDDQLSCFSDTSVVLDTDTPTFVRGYHQQDMETTPPALLSTVMW